MRTTIKGASLQLTLDSWLSLSLATSSSRSLSMYVPLVHIFYGQINPYWSSLNSISYETEVYACKIVQKYCACLYKMFDWIKWDGERVRERRKANMKKKKEEKKTQITCHKKWKIHTIFFLFALSLSLSLNKWKVCYKSTTSLLTNKHIAFDKIDSQQWSKKKKCK